MTDEAKCLCGADPYNEKPRNKNRQVPHALNCPRAPKPAEPSEAPAEEGRIYPCANCDKMRTKEEGGTVFSVCEACWDKIHGKPAPAPEPTCDYCHHPVKVHFSVKARRARRDKLAAVREEMRQRLSIPRASRVAMPTPRYDEVFEQGSAWLDALAGERLPDGLFDAAIGDDVWKSASRAGHGDWLRLMLGPHLPSMYSDFRGPRAGAGEVPRLRSPEARSEEPIEPVTELEAEKSTSKILRDLLAKAEAERDDARATKDMHKKRQEEAWAEVVALRADQADWRKGVGLIASSLGVKTLSCSHLAEAALGLRAENERLQGIKEQHNRLCLADLGGDGVWPCGCHVEIIDSYGFRKLLTAKDGEIHSECDDHAALRAELAQEKMLRRADVEEKNTLRDSLDRKDAETTALRAELAAADQNLKTMLQAAGEEAERQLAAAKDRADRAEARVVELLILHRRDHHDEPGCELCDEAWKHILTARARKEGGGR